MDGIMGMMSWPMMLGMGVIVLLLLLMLLLAAAALVKCVLGGRRS